MKEEPAPGWNLQLIFQFIHKPVCTFGHKELMDKRADAQLSPRLCVFPSDPRTSMKAWSKNKGSSSMAVQLTPMWSSNTDAHLSARAELCAQRDHHKQLLPCSEWELLPFVQKWFIFKILTFRVLPLIHVFFHFAESALEHLNLCLKQQFGFQWPSLSANNPQSALSSLLLLRSGWSSWARLAVSCAFCQASEKCEGSQSLCGTVHYELPWKVLKTSLVPVGGGGGGSWSEQGVVLGCRKVCVCDKKAFFLKGLSLKETAEQNREKLSRDLHPLTGMWTTALMRVTNQHLV